MIAKLSPRESSKSHDHDGSDVPDEEAGRPSSCRVWFLFKESYQAKDGGKWWGLVYSLLWPLRSATRLGASNRLRRRARELGRPDVEEDTIINNKERHLRYGGHHDSSYGDRRLEEERMGRRRERMLSITSGQSVSSGTIDPSRPRIGYRRSTVSSGTRHFLPSYISMDASRRCRWIILLTEVHRKRTVRLSLASSTLMFILESHLRILSPQRSVPLCGNIHSYSHQMGTPTVLIIMKRSGNVDPPAGYSSSPDSEHANSFVKNTHERLRHQVMYVDRLSSVATKTDYYNSYYSTLVHEQRSDISHRHRPSLSTSEDHSQQPPFDIDRQKKSFTRPIHHVHHDLQLHTILNLILPHLLVSPAKDHLYSKTQPPDLRYSELSTTLS